MGAHSITPTGFGKTAKEAYNNLVEEALYEDGHDGYNGTISTTGGCRQHSLYQFTGKKRATKKAIDEWVEKALDRAQKYGPVYALELPYDHPASQRARQIKRGNKAFLFAGWAAC